MGIENTARKTIIHCNESVTNSPDRCVRFLCEKQCHTSQRQPMRPLETSTDGVSATEQVVLNSPLVPVMNGDYGAGRARLCLMHIWQITAEISVAAPSDRRILGLLKISTIWVVHGDRQFQRTR
jgi:hypothetical protein